jgi:hypothetical protein
VGEALSAGHSAGSAFFHSLALFPQVEDGKKHMGLLKRQK